VRQFRVCPAPIETVHPQTGRNLTMVLGVGCDILEVSRMERELAREGGGFRDDVFTPAERAWCDNRPHPARDYAGRFAAKEALIKALGRIPDSGVHWPDMEIETVNGTAPQMVLSGPMQELAEELGIGRIVISLSGTDTTVMAVVIAEACG